MRVVQTAEARAGATPAGLMNLFVPLILDCYGPSWFEGGNLSMVLDRPAAEGQGLDLALTPGGERARLEMRNAAKDLICQGTAAGHADAGSELSRRLLTQEAAARGALRILAGAEPGREAFDIPLAAAPAAAASGEPLAPSAVIAMADAARAAVTDAQGGVFGGLEIQFLDGPLRAGVAYAGRTRIHALTESPGAEEIWYDVVIADPDSGRDRARVTCRLSFLKAASPLWTAAA